MVIHSGVFFSVRSAGADIVGTQCRYRPAHGQDIVREADIVPCQLSHILSQSMGKCEPELDAENEIATSAATKSTLRVDDICGDAADDILTAFGLTPTAPAAHLQPVACSGKLKDLFQARKHAGA